MERWRTFRHQRIYQEKDFETTSAKIPKAVRVSSRSLAVLVAMLTFGLLTWFFYWSDFFTVRRIALDGDVTDTVIGQIETLVGQHIFYVDEERLFAELVLLEPALESVALARGIPDQLQITIHRRTPVLSLEREGQRWGIDEQGIVFTLPAHEEEHLPRVVDQRPNLKVVAGERYLAQSTVGWLVEAFREYSLRFGEPLERVVIPEHTRLVDLVTPAGWSIRAETVRPVIGQFETVALILRDHRDKVHEYVDIRVNGWGYLK